MSKIVRVDLLMVDLKPKVKRVDAIQSFVSQETPIVRITDADGAIGTGYSYTIGTGGPSVMELLRRTLAPALIGREAMAIEAIWRDMLFLTHATTVGAITSIAMAAIDAALWDLKARKLCHPVHLLAGGAQESVPLYTTEGGWLHLDGRRWWRMPDAPKPRGSGAASSRSAGRSMRTSGGLRRCARPSATVSRFSPMPTSASMWTRRSGAPGPTSHSISAGSRSR